MGIDRLQKQLAFLEEALKRCRAKPPGPDRESCIKKLTAMIERLKARIARLKKQMEQLENGILVDLLPAMGQDDDAEYERMLEEYERRKAKEKADELRVKQEEAAEEAAAKEEQRRS